MVIRQTQHRNHVGLVTSLLHGMICVTKMGMSKMKSAGSFGAAGVLCAGALASFVSAASAATESVVYSFQNDGKDGHFPAAPVIEVGGTIYGTTYFGGTGGCLEGCGAIYSVDPATGTETVLYSFRKGANGGTPSPGALLHAGGRLFGTTADGGRRDVGSVFSLDLKTGTFETRYSFCNLDNCTDGEAPTSGLLDWSGSLYGTTGAGGSGGSNDGRGVVFSFDPDTGSETPLYSFNCSQTKCGAVPGTGLVRASHKLFGTTEYGGRGCQSNGDCGTVFSIDPLKGTHKVAYTFCAQQNCADGAEPNGALIVVNDVLYGVTRYGGGAGNACAEFTVGCGVVYSIDLTTHAETVLHAFEFNGTDGFEPLGALVYVNGMLYGTTPQGGAHNAGTVYSVDPSTGVETIVYAFCGQQGCADGAYPEAGLLNVNGTLFGTAYSGGTGSCSSGPSPGCGAVFAITP